MEVYFILPPLREVGAGTQAGQELIWRDHTGNAASWFASIGLLRLLFYTTVLIPLRVEMALPKVSSLRVCPSDVPAGNLIKHFLS